MKSFILPIYFNRDGHEILRVGGAKPVIFYLMMIFLTQHCALQENIIPWEYITLLAVLRNVVFHNCPGQHLNNIYPSPVKKPTCCWLSNRHNHCTVRPNKKETRLPVRYLHCHARFNQIICFIIKGIFSSFIWYQTHDDISMHDWKETI